MNNAINIKKWFYWVTSLHILLWTALPALFRNDLPLDPMEGATWGNQLEWGYDKNPFMNAWLTELGYKIGGTSGWAIYLLSQISVALCFWAIWRLGNKFLKPIHALVAVFLLEGILYFTIYTDAFNDNIIELGLWALMILSFYSALKQQKIRDWVALGIFAALAMMTKYFVAVLMLPMFLFLLRKENRASFAKPGPYIGLLVFIAIITPHVIWLTKHGFITVLYAINRTSYPPPTWLDHIVQPLNFAGAQFVLLILPLCLFTLFYLGKRSEHYRDFKYPIASYDKIFLLYMGVGPLLVTVFLSMLNGITLYASWGQPLLSLSGLLLVCYLQPDITRPKFYRFMIAIAAITLVLSIGYVTHIYRAGHHSKANFPGRELSARINKEWQQRYGTPLHYIAGERWLAGNVSFYSPLRTAVYIDWNPALSPWINAAKLRKSGGVFVWRYRDSARTLPAVVVQRFPQLQDTHIDTFAWKHDKKTTNLKIGIAFLPPTTDSKPAKKLPG